MQQSLLRTMQPLISSRLRQFMNELQLPERYTEIITTHLAPLATWIANQHNRKCAVIGINGAQGSGKSTIARCLSILLQEQHNLSAAVLSIDDLYLTKCERIKLSEIKHPLFKTRGVPGTHDVQLGINTIKRLISGYGEIAIPGFDKGSDERMPERQWRRCRAPVDIVLFEGWCVATAPQSEAELINPINELEASEDPGGIWRRAVNRALSEQYGELFKNIDRLIFLQAPDFESIHQWRTKQEQQTFSGQVERGMNDEEIKYFIQHFERLTRAALNQLPEIADVTVELNEKQNPVRCVYRS